MAQETEESVFEIDDDLQATETRIKELRKKQNRTPEEEAEFKELKSHHRGRLTEQMENEKEARVKEAERAARAEQELEQARARLKEVEDRRNAAPAISGNEDEFVMVNGKKMLTDEAINARVQANKMTQAEGWKLQKELIKETTKEEFRREANQGDVEKVRQETWAEVNREYPHFIDSKHPKHNPEDPLYKEANRLWLNGYQYNPRGLKMAITDAKKNLGMDEKKADLSEEFGAVRGTSGAPAAKSKSTTLALSAVEEENALRFYVVGNRVNNKTGKVFTAPEALAKALEAKKQRTENKRI